jgi:hypothetical protein
VSFFRAAVIGEVSRQEQEIGGLSDLGERGLDRPL